MILTRNSWDTSIKHYARLGLLNTLPDELIASIPRTNLNRWKNEANDKYLCNDLAKFISEEIAFIKKRKRIQTH